MAKSQLPFWISQLQLVYRNSSRQRRFTYKQNAYRLGQKRIKALNKNESDDANNIEFRIQGRFSSIPIADLQGMLARDIIDQQANAIQFCVTRHQKENAVVEKWEEISGLFKKRVSPHYKQLIRPQGLAKTSNECRLPDWNIIMRLPIKNTGNIEVLWPPLSLSLACKAVGLDHELFSSLRAQGVNSLYHPVTGDIMPLLQVENITPRCRAYALAPSLDESHRSLFTGSLLPIAVIPSRRCRTEEIQELKKMCITTPNEEPANADLKDRFQPADGFNSDIRSTSLLLRALDSGSFFGTEKSTRGQMCSPDILRATLLSNTVDNRQLKEEYCKISVLYSIYENLQRIRARTAAFDIPSQAGPLTKWDNFILHRVQNLKHLSNMNSINTIVAAKKEFDEFLQELNIYNVIINAELRAASKTEKSTLLSRQVNIVRVLDTVFLHCKFIGELYPSFSLELQSAVIKGNMIDVPQNEQVLGDAGEIFAIVRALVEFESQTLKTPELMRDHKVILLVGGRVSAEVARLYQFASKVELQITTNLDAANKVKHSECIRKKMVSNDTFCFLYQTKPQRTDARQIFNSVKQRESN